MNKEEEALFTEEDEIAAQLQSASKPSIDDQIKYIQNLKACAVICHCKDSTVKMLMAIEENLIAVRLFNYSSPGERIKFLMKQDPLI